LTGLIEDIALRDASGRVARHLLQTCQDACGRADGIVGLAGLKKHIASHLNLTSETFSRVLRKLADAGVVELVDDKRLRIVDRDALESLSR
jgi:CRP/FNR family transcriptional regulator